MLMDKPAMPINIQQMMDRLPHRYPFLLVDRVIDFDPGKKILVLKNVTMNEPFFNGHFPGYPIMPGVLIIEAMAQSAGILSVLSFGQSKPNELYFFAGINRAKFKLPVIPGDSLMIEVEFLKRLKGVSKYSAKATVDGVVVAKAELMVVKKEI
jgi:3-hydroxyacyl-[acyl-carrier-protein] dehydratase